MCILCILPQRATPRNMYTYTYMIRTPITDCTHGKSLSFDAQACIMDVEFTVLACCSTEVIWLEGARCMLWLEGARCMHPQETSAGISLQPWPLTQ